MKKLVLLFLFAGMVATGASAQGSFSQSAGLSFFSATNATGAAGTYSPRYNLLQISDEMTFSIGTHASLGFSMNSRSGGSLVLDLPAMAELNLGHASSEDSDAGFGGFLGLGFGYNLLAGEGPFGGFTNQAYGPVLGGGIRFEVLQRSYYLRASYLISVNQGHNNVLGLGFGLGF